MFSWKDAESLKNQCEKELNKNKHRTKKRRIHSKRKYRSDGRYKWQEVDEKNKSELSFNNYEEWSRMTRSYDHEGDLVEPLEANPDQLQSNDL